MVTIPRTSIAGGRGVDMLPVVQLGHTRVPLFLKTADFAVDVVSDLSEKINITRIKIASVVRYH